MNGQQLMSVSSGQQMGIRDSLSNSIPNSRDTNRLILHDGNQAIVSAPPSRLKKLLPFPR